MKYNIDNATLNARLIELRDDLRHTAGFSMYYDQLGEEALFNEVAKRLNKDSDFVADDVHPKTLLRLQELFAVPTIDHGDHVHYPTDADTARAIQNFINRRNSVWSFFNEDRPDVEIEAGATA